MDSVADFFFSLLKFVGLLEEPPPLRRKFKRNRVHDDFSSDDEPPVMSCQQVKRTRWSGYVATFDNGDNEGKHNNPTRNVPDYLKGSYTTSTPKDFPKSPKRKVPVDLPGLSKNGPSSPPKKTNAEVDIKQKDPKVARVESKLAKTKKKPCSMDHVEIDDGDSQRGDDVIFVKEVTSPPEHVFAKNSHAAGLNDQVLKKIKSDKNLDYKERLWRIANSIIPMSKDIPIVDGQLAEDSASCRLPKSTKIKNTTQNNDKILNEIKLDSELNADTYQNAPLEQDTIRVSPTDSSDSDDDVEVVPLESSTTSSVRKDSKRNITELSRNGLLDSLLLHSEPSGSECNNKLSKNQAKINDARRISDIASKVNSQQNEDWSPSTKTINDWLAKKDANYFLTLLKTPEKLNDMQKNETQSYKPDITRAGLSRLESKNKTSPIKLHEKYNYASQESEIVSEVNTVQDEAELGTTRAFLARLEAEYFSTPTETKENLVNPRHESNIVPKVNGEQDDIRSYLPAASRNWLLELDAKYKTTTQKNQENLNNAKQELNNVSKVNDEDRSPKLGSTDDWLAEVKSRLNAVQNNNQEDLNDASKESVIVKKLHTARERLSISDSNPKTEQPKMQEKLNDSHEDVNRLSKVNSEQNEARSFKFNTSEDLMLKLGSLYDKFQQEKRRKSLLNPDEIKQVNLEQKHELSKSKTEKSDVEIQSNVDLPVLTPEQEELVDRAFKPEPEEEMLVEKFNMRIHRRDLQTLSDLNWLNDEVINFYMNLIMQRSERRKHLPKVYATNTFFYPKFKQGGQAGLRRWTRKIDIFAYDLFMVPVNIDHHWCLSIVDFRERIIKYLDSRGSPNQECLDGLLQYLKDEHQDKKGAPFDVSGWKTECVKDIPQQMNGSDCGMFACTFAEFSSRGAAYSFTQAHMPYLRRKAALEILMGKLLL